jgi:hypothetical protein
MNKAIFKSDNFKVFFENWSSAEDVFEAFYNVAEEDRQGVNFIYAHYDCEGHAFVIYLKNGKLYEVNGSHCSCNGLEGMWEPEETSLDALMFRPNVPDEAKANLKRLYPNLMCFL